MSFTAYVLFSLRLFKLKTERQAMETENLTEKLQNWNQLIVANSGLAQ